MQDLIDRVLYQRAEPVEPMQVLREVSKLLTAYTDQDQHLQNVTIGSILATVIDCSNGTESVVDQLNERYFHDYCDSEKMMEQFTDLMDSCGMMFYKLDSNHDTPYQNVLDSIYTITRYIEGFPPLRECLELHLKECNK